MNNFRIPPMTKAFLTPPEVLAEHLRPLIGTQFHLTPFPRTNGSKVRKLIVSTLEQHELPPPCHKNSYTVVPSKGKGVPRMLLEFIDTYIVTTGDQYNLQVWNRNPASNSTLVEYASGEKLSANEVRFVFVRVDPHEHYIRSILILSPAYIETNFGPFGKETTKQQLIITSTQRERILHNNPPVLFYPDTPTLAPMVSYEYITPKGAFRDRPISGKILALEVLRDRLCSIIGTRLDTADTKTRGQALERLVAQRLGYTLVDNALLLGNYLDILNQILEVKVQESPTVDLGKFSPQFKEGIPSCPGISTEDVRYLITLIDKSTSRIEGIILCPGSRLGDHFSYVGSSSYKCQRSIPMTFFNKYDGQSLFNP